MIRTSARRAHLLDDVPLHQMCPRTAGFHQNVFMVKRCLSAKAKGSRRNFHGEWFPLTSMPFIVRLKKIEGARGPCSQWRRARRPFAHLARSCALALRTKARIMPSGKSTRPSHASQWQNSALPDGATLTFPEHRIWILINKL